MEPVARPPLGGGEGQLKAPSIISDFTHLRTPDVTHLKHASNMSDSNSLSRIHFRFLPQTLVPSNPRTPVPQIGLPPCRVGSSE